MRNLSSLVVAFGLSLSPVLAQEPMRVEPVTLASANESVMVNAEIAETEDQRARGLMFRHRLPEGQAMLFDFGTPRPASMWMKNTYMALDMLFVRADGTIAAIAENTVPKSLDTISVQEPVRSVIELPAGTVKKLGLQQNDHVYHRIFSEAE